MGRRWAAVAAVGLLTLTGGCSSPAGDGAPSAPTPQAGPVTTALMHTRGLGTARLDVEARVRLAAASRRLTASGAASLDRGTGRLRIVDAQGGAREYRRTGKGLFVADGSTGPWTLYADPFDRPGGALTDPLRGLGQLQGSRVSADDRGTVVTATATATDDQLRQVGLTDEELASLPDEATRPPVTVTVRIDPSGRIVEVGRAWAAGDAEAVVVTRLDDFRVPLNLTVPESASVTATVPATPAGSLPAS